MPTLEWIGKDKVINHHQEVPFRVLERKYSFDENGQTDADNGSENMIIRGDNLEALKALLPRYEGRVKCIYIDPPYNTGNEGWVYNDNVNDPKIKKWLGEVVGKEGEDLTRHDKWLCMMYPRLKLLQKLLAEDGAIFISIDDNELYTLKMVCDEIFGTSNFIANVIWQKTYSPRNDALGIPYETDNILVYSKCGTWHPNKLPRTIEMDNRHDSPDNDPIPWQSGDVSAAGAADHQGMVYAIQQPITGKLLYPASGRHWKDEQSVVLQRMNKWAKYELRNIDDAPTRAALCGLAPETVRQDVMAVMLAQPVEEAATQAIERYERGIWPEYYFTSKGRGGIRFKNHIKENAGKSATNLWSYNDVGHTDEAKKEIKAIFNGVAPIETPKPSRLIERVLHIATDNATIILDSFAGSGTTAHAVLNMNKADGGNRKFILIEMMDYADSITAERVKRVINGYGEGKNAVEGTGGSFSFYDLGEPLMIGECLNERVAPEKIREYIWFMETRTPFNSEFGMRNSELRMHNSECGIHNSECAIHNSGLDGTEQFRSLNSEFEMRNAELDGTEQFRSLNSECMTHNSECGSLNSECAIHNSELDGTEQFRITNSEFRINNYFLGRHNHTDYYFYYEPQRVTVLDYAFLATITEKADGTVIYADRCAISEDKLSQMGITFKKIPRDISKL